MNEGRKEGTKERTNERTNDYSYRLGTSEHDKKWGVKRHMWAPHLKKYGEKWKSQLTPGPRGSAAPAVGDRAFPVAGRSATLCPVFANKKLSIADKPRDAFRSQSMSPNIVPFDMLGMVS